MRRRCYTKALSGKLEMAEIQSSELLTKYALPLVQEIDPKLKAADFIEKLRTLNLIPLVKVVNVTKPPDPRKSIWNFTINWLKANAANVDTSIKPNRVQAFLAWEPPLLEL